MLGDLKNREKDGSAIVDKMRLLNAAHVTMRKNEKKGITEYDLVQELEDEEADYHLNLHKH